MNKVLIICGPTGVGKTGFTLDMASEFNGELVSADSRQVYTGMDIVTGKDLPANAEYRVSNIEWKGRKLKYYLIQGIKVWLYDIVNPDEEFNVSFWRECATLVIKDIHSRGKLPIVVGGTGLYIRSLLENLSNIDIPHDPILRSKLNGQSTDYLFEYLKLINPDLANSLNESDRRNPVRLIRKIETSGKEITQKIPDYDFFQVGLTAPIGEIDKRIVQRIKDRIVAGAKKEYEKIRGQFDNDLPSLTASGYRDWEKWEILEKQYARRQLTWFKKFGNVQWFDITHHDWKFQAKFAILKWYAEKN